MRESPADEPTPKTHASVHLSTCPHASDDELPDGVVLIFCPHCHRASQAAVADDGTGSVASPGCVHLVRGTRVALSKIDRRHTFDGECYETPQKAIGS